MATCLDSVRLRIYYAIVLTALLPTISSAQVTVFEHTRFRGTSATFSADVSDLSKSSGPCSGRGWNDCVSSLRVASGWTATVFERNGFSGASYTLRGDVSTLGALPGPCGGTFNECVSSIRVSRDVPTVTLRITKSGTGTGRVTSSPAGVDCGQTCSATFAIGTQVALTASADSGSVTQGFSGACQSGGAFCTLVLTSDATVTTAFARQGPTGATVRVTRSGRGVGEVMSAPTGIACGATCTATFALGTFVEFTARPDDISVFGGFSGACETTERVCRMFISSDANLTAKFDEPPPTGSVSDFVRMSTRSAAFSDFDAVFRFVFARPSIPTAFSPLWIKVTIPGEYAVQLLQVPEGERSLAFMVGGDVLFGAISGLACSMFSGPLAGTVCGGLTSGIFSTAKAFTSSESKTIERMWAPSENTSGEYLVLVSSLPARKQWQISVTLTDQFGRTVSGPITLSR